MSSGQWSQGLPGRAVWPRHTAPEGPPPGGVDRGPAQYGAHPGATRCVAQLAALPVLKALLLAGGQQLLEVMMAAVTHGAKLEHDDRLPVAPDPLAAVKNRQPGIEPDRDGDQ